MFRASSTTMSTSSDVSVWIHEIERVMKVRGGIDITGFEEMLSLRHLFCFTTKHSRERFHKHSRERFHRRKRVLPPPYLRSCNPVYSPACAASARCCLLHARTAPQRHSRRHPPGRCDPSMCRRSAVYIRWRLSSRPLTRPSSLFDPDCCAMRCVTFFMMTPSVATLKSVARTSRVPSGVPSLKDRANRCTVDGVATTRTYCHTAESKGGGGRTIRTRKTPKTQK